MNRSAGQLLADALVEGGIARFYTVPGESFLEVLEALRANPAAALVSTRHESGASFMALAEAALTGRPAVAMATRAPGAANLAIGVETAWHDSTPLVALIGHVEQRWYGSDLAFQEIDLEAFYRPFTKWATTLRSAGDAAVLARRAIEVATSGRPGPVMVAMPADVLAELAGDDAVPAPPGAAGAAPGIAPAPAAIAELGARLAAAARPVMIVGGRTAGHLEGLVRLAEGHGIGVYCAFRRQDRFPNDHACYLGHLTIGTDPGLLVPLEEADVVLALGCRLSEVTTQDFSLPGEAAYFAHVDAGPSAPGPGRKPDLEVVCDIGGAVSALLAELAAGCAPDFEGRWAEAHGRYERHAAPPPPSVLPLVQPSEVAAAICRVLPPYSVIANDAGNFAIPLHRQWHFNRPFSQLAPTNGAMGYAVPAGVAAALVRPERSVVAVAGDGGYLMTGQEVETAVRLGVKLVVVVMRNGLYGTIAMHQARAFGDLAAAGIGEVDLAAHARSLGAAGITVTGREQLDDALREAVGAGGTVVVDVPVDPDAVTPELRLSELQAAARRARGGGPAAAR
ncbi:MAG TPA: thiamine pyrophosphate-dependent enzyme [Acidimicrobiales bacterium]|nr:thiamine pyrophosphate-dependent enzyme [Acidimicrobiales bacterium]